MRSHLKLALAPLLLLAACTGSNEDTNSAESTKSAGETSAQKPAQPGVELDAIGTLVRNAGKIDTDRTPDIDPVQVEKLEDATVSEGASSFLCSQARYSLTKVPDRFVAVNPNADVLWPGSLVQGKSLAGGVLDPIPAHRAPGTITLTLASGSGGTFFRKLEEPSLSSVMQAENEILAGCLGRQRGSRRHGLVELITGARRLLTHAWQVEQMMPTNEP